MKIKLMKNRVLTFLFFLFRPSFWSMNYPYSKEWNNKLMELMENKWQRQ